MKQHEQVYESRNANKQPAQTPDCIMCGCIRQSSDEAVTSLNKLAAEIHDNSKKHGWWAEPRSFGEIIALCHSELSEALEEYRNGRPPVWFACIPTDVFAGCKNMTHCKNEKSKLGCTSDKRCQYKDSKPEGIAVELADCIIRILDYCGHEGIDIDKIIRAKMEYNKSRPYRHGGKVI